MSTDPFAIFDNDLEALRAMPAERKPVLENIEPTIAARPCPKCHGTGRFSRFTMSGQCFACKGTGKLDAVREKRRTAYAKGEQTKAERRAAEARAWAELHKIEHADLVESAARGNEFAQRMLNAVAEWGSLTPNQLAAVRKGILAREAKRAEFRAADEARKSSAPAISVQPIEQAFERALAAGLKSPRLNIAGFCFTKAKPDSRNPGAIYVKRSGEYPGQDRRRQVSVQPRGRRRNRRRAQDRRRSQSRRHRSRQAVQHLRRLQSPANRPDVRRERDRPDLL